MKRFHAALCVVAGVSLAMGTTSTAQAPLPSHGPAAQPAQPAQPAQTAQPAQGAQRATAAGIQWSVPDSWTSGQGSAMRVATYAVPGVKGAEAAECAVFYFGRGQGGGVDDNVVRWSRQFKEAPEPKPERLTAAGLNVTRVDFRGTYLNPGGSMMQSQDEKPGYRLLGAIVEAPGGQVFFKLTGPAATVAAAEGAFDSLIASLART